MVNRNINKKDVEAFLSVFKYNAYGATNIDSVSKIVFTNDNYVSKELARKTRANPPPDAVNIEMLESIRSIDIEDNPVVSNPAIDYKKAAAVLREIENKVFVGGLPRAGTYQSVYRSLFDCDGDGFISHADFEGACRKLQVQADPKSILHAIRALDTDQKGYLDYRAFSKKIAPGMSERMSALEERHTEDSAEVQLPEVVPTKQRLRSHIQKTQGVQQTVRDVRNAFNPDHEHKLVIPTRFSSKPTPPNTFLNFQPVSTQAAAHFTEAQRFTAPTGNRNIQTNVDYQREDRMKKLNLQ
jgi:hypothetical protein